MCASIFSVGMKSRKSFFFLFIKYIINMTSIKPFKEHRISGKDWKSKKTSKSSFSIVSRVKSQKGFEANQAKSNALKLLKITENELKQVKKDEKVRKRIEAKERLERILINEKKAQITQIVSSKKVKRMNKKQLKALIKK